MHTHTQREREGEGGRGVEKCCGGHHCFKKDIRKEGIIVIRYEKLVALLDWESFVRLLLDT